MSDDQNSASTASVKPVIPKPRPGKYPVHQKVVMQANSTQKGVFTHSEPLVQLVGEVLHNTAFGLENRYNHDPPTDEEYRDITHRWVSAGMAKKLATALSPGQRLSHEGKLSGIAKAPISGPSAFAHFFDLFGCVSLEKQEFELIGQPALAFTYFYRAVARGVVRRTEAYAYNLAWTSGHRDLLEYFSGLVGAWARNQPPRQFQFGGAGAVVMSIPAPTSGFAAYFAFIEHVNPPVHVVRALRIGAILEAIGQAPTDAQVAQLQDLGVFVVNWNGVAIHELWSNYSNDVEMKLRTTYAAAANWVPYQAFKTIGNPGQLLHRKTEELFTGPFVVGGGDLDLGWMVAGLGTSVVPATDVAFLIPPKPVRFGISDFVSSMFKN